MAEEDRRPPPAPLGKGPVVGRRAVVGVDDEPLDADRQAVVHRVGDERAAADRKERLGAVLRQRAEARPQPRPENEGRPDLCSSFIADHSLTRTLRGHRRNIPRASEAPFIASPFFPERGIDLDQRRHDEAGDRREEDPEEEAGIAQLLLDPAARHRRDHHPEGHDPRRDRVMDCLVLPFGDHDHDERIGREAETVAELLCRHGGLISQRLSGIARER